MSKQTNEQTLITELISAEQDKHRVTKQTGIEKNLFSMEQSNYLLQGSPLQLSLLKCATYSSGILPFEVGGRSVLITGTMFDKEVLFPKEIAHSSRYGVKLSSFGLQGTNSCVEMDKNLTQKKSIITSKEGNRVQFLEEICCDDMYILAKGNVQGSVLQYASLDVYKDGRKEHVDLTKVTQYLAQAVTNNLHTIKHLRKTKKDQYDLPSTSKHTGLGFTEGGYAGLLDGRKKRELKDIENRKIASRDSFDPHVRSAERRFYERSGKTFFGPPKLVHADKFTPEQLREHFFTPEGLPTVEAYHAFRGQLSDDQLHKLLVHDAPSKMSDIYGVDIKK